MIAHRLSGSRVALAMLCGYSARGDVPRPPRVETAAASAGTIEHAYIAHTIDAVAETGIDSSSAKSPTHAAWLADWWAREWGNGWRAEVAYALSPGGTQAMAMPSSGGHRDYSACPPGWVPMTLDAVLVDDGRARIVDWKTGIAAHVEPIARNAQLLTAAVAVATAHGCSEVEIAVAYCSPDGVRVDATTLDAIDLGEWRARFAAVVDSIADAEPQPGPHCRGKFCDAYGTTCPATSAALAQVSPEALRVVTDYREITGPDHATALYHAARAAKARLDAVWDALRVYAEHVAPIDVGDGVEFSARESTREALSLETRAAVDALKRELGPAWEQAVTLDTSKSAIKLAARTVKEATGEPIAKVEARVLAALREAGAVKTTTSTRVEERAAKKGEAA